MPLSTCSTVMYMCGPRKLYSVETKRVMTLWDIYWVPMRKTAYNHTVCEGVCVGVCVLVNSGMCVFLSLCPFTPLCLCREPQYITFIKSFTQTPSFQLWLGRPLWRDEDSSPPDFTFGVPFPLHHSNHLRWGL